MMTLFHHYVEISDRSGIIKGDNKFEVVEVEVLAENDRFLVIRDTYFTTIDKNGGKYCVGSPLNREVIHTSSSDSTWGNRITYSLYSTTWKRASSIRKAIETEMKKRFGFFGGTLDLSIIVNKKGGE